MSSKIDLRDLSLNPTKYSSAIDETDFVIKAAISGQCLNPFEPPSGKPLPRYDNLYILRYNPISRTYYDYRDGRQVGFKVQPQPDPTFVYNEWVSCEEEAMELLEVYKTTYKYRTHGVYRCENRTTWCRVELQW